MATKGGWSYKFEGKHNRIKLLAFLALASSSDYLCLRNGIGYVMG